MRILFFSPPWADIHGSFDELAKVQAIDPPLGICYLAAIAEKLGHECKIIDAEAERLPLAKQVEKTLEWKPDLIGITSTTPTFDKAVKYAKAIKKKSKIPIMVGGPHITVLRKKEFHACFDYGFIAECEKAWEKFLKAYPRKSFAKVPNLMYRKGKKIIINPLMDFISDVDKIPFPARHLLNHELYAVDLPKKGRVHHATMITMRGCPYFCVFCSQHTMFGRKVRQRSVKNVADEIEACIKLGLRHIVFVDSTLTLNRRFIMGLSKEIMKRKLKITWEGWTRANLIDEELLRTMKKVGFIRISFGIESGDPKILKLIKKEVDLDTIRKAYKLVKKLDIEATCSVMMGHPGETMESLMKTIEFVKSIKEVKYSPISIATPYPGTELYEMAKKRKHGLKLEVKDFSKFTRYDGAVMSVNDLSRKDLVRMQKMGLLKIHLTPERIWYNLKRSGFKSAVKNSWAFLKAVLK